MTHSNTRDKILSVADKLFSRYGFHKTSMDEIAKTARKAKGSLYYHFASKEDLFTAVVEKEMDNLKHQLSLIITNNQLTADKKIKQYLIKRMQILYDAANYQEALKADFYEHFDFIDDLREDLISWEKIQIKNILLQGIEENIFEPNTSENIDVMLDVFIMVLKGLEVPFLLQGKYEEYSPYFGGLLNILIKGVSK